MRSKIQVINDEIKRLEIEKEKVIKECGVKRGDF